MRRPATHRAFKATVWLLLGAFAVAGPLTGCAWTSTPPNPQTATDPDAPAARRRAAINAYPSDSLFELFELVTVARHPLALRSSAVDRMLDADADRFWQTAALRSTQIDDWPMIRLLCERATERREASALPWLVRSWSAPSTTVADRDRPERVAIAAITQMPAEDWLGLRVFFPDKQDELHAQIAAWTILARTRPIDELFLDVYRAKFKLQKTPLLDALDRCEPVLDVFPTDRESLSRLFTLIDRYPESTWDRWQSWKERHDEDRPSTLALRHLPAINRMSREAKARGRDQWLGQLTHRLEGKRHVHRGEDVDEHIVTARPERLVDHTDAIGIADLIVLDALLEALDDDAIIAELFRQADADRLDTATEHGGVITWDEEGNPVANPFVPLMRQHDQVYYASDDCVRAMHTGLAHYHFHAQQHENAAWAGPGTGDLGFADRLHANCVVFTFIDADTLNADAYFPGGIIVDLGCISRSP